MAKRILKFTVWIILAISALAAYLLFSGATRFDREYQYFYIHSNKADRESVLQQLSSGDLIGRVAIFDWLANHRGYWKQVKPGKYKIKKGTSIFRLVNMLKAGRQDEVKLVIGKLRLPEEMAGRLSNYIEEDSVSILGFLRNKDSLQQYDIDEFTWMTTVIPNTYNIYWTWKPGYIFKKLQEEQKKWWSRNGRMQKAESKGLKAEEIYTLASIVEEETNMTSDKPLVASVYLNRIKKNMPLQADPTVRYALKNFVSNRVTLKQLRTASPYNTYINKGLPPGPICIPSITTLDAVLDAPQTDYLYFVAKPDFSGYSVFSNNYADHSKAAKAYQDSLNAYLKRKAAKETAENPTK